MDYSSPNIDALRLLYADNATAKAFFAHAARRERDQSETKVDRILVRLRAEGHEFRRREIDGRTGCDYGRSSRANGRPGDRCIAEGKGATGVGARLSLRARVEPLSARERNDRGRPRGRARDGFQSRIVANTEYADGSFARLHANEDVACGSDHRVND